MVELSDNEYSDSLGVRPEKRSRPASASVQESHSLRERITQLEYENEQLLYQQNVATERAQTVETALLELEARSRKMKSLSNLREASEKHYRELFNLAPVACLSLDNEGVIKKVNLAASCFLKMPSTHLLGTQFSQFFGANDNIKEYLGSVSSNRFANKWQGALYLPSGESTPVVLLTSVVHAKATDKDSYQVAVVDISEQLHNEKLLRNANLFLEELAHHDPLTSLPNRTLFRDNLQSLVRRAAGKRGRVGLIYFDLDGFKPINDSMGHDVGDRLLQLVAQRMKRLLRDNDTAARMGGDEFTIIMDNPESEAEALIYANSFARAIREPFHLDNTYINISASVGVCLYPDHAEQIDNLIKGADAAMYSAKQFGRDQVVMQTSESLHALSTPINQQRQLTA